MHIHHHHGATMAHDDLHPLDLDQPVGIVDHDDADYGAGHHNDHDHDDADYDVPDTVIVNDGRVVVHVNAAPGIIDHIATVVLHDQHGARVDYVKRSAVVDLDRAWRYLVDLDRTDHDGTPYVHIDPTQRELDHLVAARRALDL